MTNRYLRQTILSEFGEDGQKSLLMYLVSAGVGEISIIDDDRIDESNLQRQVLYTTADQGLYKAEISTMLLESLNPNVKITPHKIRLDTENAEEFLTDFDIILDGSDNFETRYLVNDTAIKLNIPVVFGAITGWEGQVSVFGNSGACYRCLYPQKPKADIRNCAEAGAIGAVAGVIGSLMALETIKLLVNSPALKTLTDKLFIIDGRTMETKSIPVKKSTTCVCGNQLLHNKQA